MSQKKLFHFQKSANPLHFGEFNTKASLGCMLPGGVADYYSGTGGAQRRRFSSKYGRREMEIGGPSGDLPNRRFVRVLVCVCV